VENLLAAVEVLDELGNAAGVFELDRFRLAGFGVVGALVGEGDDKTFVEESEFAQALSERVEVVFGGGENGTIGQERDLGAALLGGAGLL